MSASHQNQNSSYNNTFSGTTTNTPNAPSGWQSAWNSFQPGATGLNQSQTNALNFFQDQLNNSSASGNLGYINTNFNNPLATQAAHLQAGGIAPVTAQQVQAQSGAADSAPYASLYSQQLIDPSLNAYDYGTGRAFSALDARTAGAGAFGNDRSGLAYSDLGQQSALGRGQLESQLKTAGLSSALGYGQQDASRNLSADTTNAANNLSAGTFNANLLNNQQQFNALQQNQNDQTKLAASAASAGNIMNDANLHNTNAMNLLNGGALGNQQNLNWLNAGLPLFGSTSDSQGQSQGTSTGSGSSKGFSL